VLNAIQHEGQSSIAAESVDRWLRANGGNYIENFEWVGNIADLNWLKGVHAPKLLTDLFDQLSGVNLAYQKTAHSVLLTEWILANHPNSLSELADYIEHLTPKVIE
jgi:hypothetical protein